MKKINTKIVFLLPLYVFSLTATAQIKNTNPEISFYKKKEINKGLKMEWNREREELLTDNSKSYEEIETGNLSFQLTNRFWNFLDYKQEQFEFDFKLGPFGGYGNWQDSTSLEESIADHNLYGIRSRASASYLQRYYYGKRSFTLVEFNGWARYDWYNQKSEGTQSDSLGILTDIDHKSTETKLRYGFEAKAGWGTGRLNPMNHVMLAQFILDKYYAGRVFSDDEIARVVSEIRRIKEKRSPSYEHDIELENALISDFLKEKLLLQIPGGLEKDWELGEFMPRFDGNRLEIGPFFRYYNREPDFIYGGYVRYENAKYIDFKWNRTFKAGLNYNSYKKQDWISAEINIGWSYFPDLKQEIDFGVRYIPGIEVDEFTEYSNFSHGMIPYVGYYSQLNSKARINLVLAYRITGDDEMMLPGPEISLSFYRSKY